MSHRSTSRDATRLAGALALAGLAWLSAAGPAGAATPDPLGGPLTTVTGPVTSTVTPLLGGSATPAPPAVPSPAGAPAPPSRPAVPALPGQEPRDGAQDRSGVSAEAAAPAGDDDTVVAADASVRNLLGACVRLTRAGVPARTTVVVLDQNLIDQLTAVGLPLDRLLVPCPAGTAIRTPVETGSGTTRAAATTGDPAQAGTLGRLAFTGTNLPATLLLAAGFLALGIAFLRKAHQLAAVR